MRAYVLVHSALSGIQKGIQAAHAMVEMGLGEHPLFAEWAESHKTVIVLEGGFHADLLAAEAGLEAAMKGRGRLPWAVFREDKETMNGMVTAVAVVVPERMWDAPAEVCEMGLEGLSPLDEMEAEEYPTLAPWEAHVMRILANRPLAR